MSGQILGMGVSLGLGFRPCLSLTALGPVIEAKFKSTKLFKERYQDLRNLGVK